MVSHLASDNFLNPHTPIVLLFAPRPRDLDALLSQTRMLLANRVDITLACRCCHTQHVCAFVLLWCCSYVHLRASNAIVSRVSRAERDHSPGSSAVCVRSPLPCAPACVRWCFDLTSHRVVRPLLPPLRIRTNLRPHESPLAALADDRSSSGARPRVETESHSNRHPSSVIPLCSPSARFTPRNLVALRFCSADQAALRLLSFPSSPPHSASMSAPAAAAMDDGHAAAPAAAAPAPAGTNAHCENSRFQPTLFVRSKGGSSVRFSLSRRLFVVRVKVLARRSVPPIA